MTYLLFIKTLVLSFVWTVGSFIYFVTREDSPTTKRVLIIFAPWISMLSYFLLFYWG
jgi:hypothetical protein